MSVWKRLVLAACGCSAACALAVDVDSASVPNDPAVAFAVKDVQRYLKDVPGKIRLQLDAALDHQAWRLKTQEDGTLVVSGRDGLGLVYGLYSFLERHAGVRWYAPDTEKAADISRLPAVDETFRPAMAMREMYTSDDGATSAVSLWRLRNRETRRSSCGTETTVGRPRDCHSMDEYVKCVTNEALFGVTESGKKCRVLCMSNPEVIRLVAAEMKRYIAKDRAACEGKPPYRIPRLYELSQPDGGPGAECHCPACHAAYVSAGNRYAGPNIRFANAVAAEVAKTHPDVRIRTFAYSYTELPPADVKAADNVEVRFCRSLLAAPLVKGSYNGDVMEAWNRCAAHLQVWGYWRTYSGPGFPVVKPRADIGAELRYCRDCGVSGYVAEAEAPLSRSFSALQHWLFLKLTEDPDRDVFALAAEFMRAYYGAGADAMTQYLSYLEARFVAMREKIDPEFLRKTNSGDLAMFTVCTYLDADFFRKVYGFLDAAVAATAGDDRALLHVRQERAVVDRAIFENLAALEKEGYVPDVPALAARYGQDRADTFKGWSFPPKVLKARLASVSNELAVLTKLPAPLPDALKGRDVVTYYCTRMGESRRAFEKDPEAAVGIAAYNRVTDVTRFPFEMGFYCRQMGKSDVVKLNRADIPQDEKYHLYRLGAGRTPVSGRLYFDYTWAFMMWLPCFGTPAEEREFWATVKFTGPAFVTGSTAPNRALIDRVFIVKP